MLYSARFFIVRVRIPERRVMARSQEKRSSQRWSDEELEYYGELYLSRGMREAGVEFEAFLSNPEYYLAKYPRRDGRRDVGDNGTARRGLLRFFGSRSASRSSD
jgi:hypothetical protein